MTKNISLLGSTGSIGVNTLNVIRHLNQGIKVTALAAKSNIDLLEQQAKEFHPDLIAVYDKDKARELQKRLPKMRIAAGMEGVMAAAAHTSANFVVSAMTGTLGLLPTVEAIKAGKNIGLANKEALISGGALVTSLAREKGVKIIPIDSEHSALFQCLEGENPKTVHRLILTASGGPFRNSSAQQLSEVTVDHALRHPNWNMGPKVTIDCSTLMNKGLEVIEAHWLFDIPVKDIEVVLQPQSIIHSLVEYKDGSILAQMSEPTMIVPIQFAITYPVRYPGMLKPFDFTKQRVLEFFPPDYKKFRCLSLAYQAIKTGGSLPCYMNAANEVLVNRFISKQLKWLEIGEKLEKLMQAHQVRKIDTLDNVLEIDALARQEAERA